MRRTAALGAVLLAILLIAGGAIAGDKVSRGVVDEAVFAHATSHFLEPDDTAGSAGTLFAKVESLGKVEIDVSASWDWSAWDPTRHPCALVDIDGHGFVTDVVTGTFPLFLSPWSSTATVDIRAKKGEINAAITGGSVCEIEYLLDEVTGAIVGTVNEWFISFGVTGGTEKFSDATGSGWVHYFWNSVTGEFGIHEVFVHLDK